MFQQSSYTEQLTFFQKLRSFDFILIICVLILGLISNLSMYSTDGGEFLYHTKSHLVRFLVFFTMMVFFSFFSLRFWHATAYLFYVIVLGFLITISALKFGPIINISFLLAIIGSAFYYSNQLFLNEKVLFDPTFAGFSTFVIYFGNTFANYLRDANEKKQIRGAFSQYLSPALVEQLAEDPDKLVLGGETKKMTFLFCDVRGFTTISESFKSDPQGLTKLINRFLTPLTNEIINVNGTIDKYMGDCIMAFWNAPIDVDGHEKLACDATLRMHKAMAELNAIRVKEAKTEKKNILNSKSE